MTISPIALTVYNRKTHFLETVASLAGNSLADQTVMFVAIDAPYRDEDVAVNREIVDLAKKIKGFKSVEVIQQATNVGAVRNSDMLTAEIFSAYDAMVKTEDDNVFSPFFLEYVNAGLNKYRDDQSIFAICGYLEPLADAFDGSADVFARTGFTSNGFGIWRDRLARCDFAATDFLDSYNDPREFSRFCQSFGYHVVAGLVHSKVHRKMFQDFAICHSMFARGQKCIFPAVSLVRNIGQDGSGMNSGVNSALQSQQVWERGTGLSHELNSQFDEKMACALRGYHHKSDFFVLARYFQYMYAKFKV